MQKTNLNISPYYDDYRYENDFHRILFRPGYAIQARELTQLQSILQNQIEQFGRHFFKEGSVVIPGQTGYTNEFYAVKLKDTFGGNDVLANLESVIGKYITGETSGVKGRVITYTESTSDDPVTLFVKYTSTGTDGVEETFRDGEKISDETLGNFAELLDSDATATGASASIEEGVYFIRGHFIRVAKQRIILSKYTNEPNARIGLEIAENIITPEGDSTLLDNAQGTSNYNAKGAHRLQMTLTLASRDLGSAEDVSFVDLMQIKRGAIQSNARATQYSVMDETLARRTYDESGDYSVKTFTTDIRETLNDGTNNGVYGSEISTTDSGNTPSDDLMTIEISPGKAYVRGYEIETVAPTYIDVPKPRTYETVSEENTPIEVGNYVVVNNSYGIPNIDIAEASGNIHEPYDVVELYDNFYTAKEIYDDFTLTKKLEPSSLSTFNGNPIGVARARGYETSSIIGSNKEHKLYLFDVKMYTEIELWTPVSDSRIVVGDKITGVISKASGYVEKIEVQNGYTRFIYLSNVVGNFTTEKLLSSRIDNGSYEINSDYTITLSGTDATFDGTVSTIPLKDTVMGLHPYVQGTGDATSNTTRNIPYDISLKQSPLSGPDTIFSEHQSDDITVTLDGDPNSPVAATINIQTQEVSLKISQDITSETIYVKYNTTGISNVIGKSFEYQIDGITNPVKSFNFDQVKSVYTEYGNDSVYTNDYIADAITLTENNQNTNTFQLTGSISLSKGSSTISGFSTKFNTELKTGDVLEVPTGEGGSSEFVAITEVISDTSAEFVAITGTGSSDMSGEFVSIGATSPAGGRPILFTILKDGNQTNGVDDDYPGIYRIDYSGTYTSGDEVTVNRKNKNLYDDYAEFGTILGSTPTLLGPYEYIRITTDVTSVIGVRHRTTLKDQQKNLMIRKLKKDTIKTLKTIENDNTPKSDVIVTNQFIQNASNNSVSISLPGTDIFYSSSKEDLVVSNITTGEVYNNDDLTITGLGSTQLTIGAPTIPNGSNIKVIATIKKNDVSEKTKTMTAANLLIVENKKDDASDTVYGTSVHHTDISLGYADVFRMHAILESDDKTSDPNIPEYKITQIGTDVFTAGELFRGTTSNAFGVIVTPKDGDDKIKYILKSQTEFLPNETIVGSSSGAQATMISKEKDGSTDITKNFLLDNGQRDNFYDIGRVIRKPNAPEPKGKLLIIFDYFQHGSGNFFTVDSYGSVDYKEIPTYSATRIDPEVREPTGEYSLRDSIDFRARVANISNTGYTSTNGQNYGAKVITGNSFNFSSRSYNTANGASIINIPKDGSLFQYDFEYYLSRIDDLYVKSNGEFKVISGSPAEIPEAPKSIDNAMKLGRLSLPAYLGNIEEARFEKTTNRRYTMRDIGKLEKRLENIEYYTSLNLLEKAAESTQIKDANGLDRFKSGFVVDNFKGHGTGDVKHPDYRVAVDMDAGLMRPKHYMKNISFSEKATTDSERLSNGYQRTGSIITLPYSDVISSQQPYATRVENVNPVLSFSWSGVCKLDPSGDEWFEVDRAPALYKNVEGNFDSVLAQNKNSIGTVWNSWQTQWSGRIDKVESTTTNRFWWWSKTVTRGKEYGNSVRTGSKTEVVPQIDYESQGDRVVSQALIPFIRSRNVTFEAKGMKPQTKVYAFFDKTAVSAYCTPDGGILGGDLKTDGKGYLKGIFQIPNPNIEGNPKFKTGERLFRLTSSEKNEEQGVTTFAQEIYTAKGILNTVQETIHAVRNGRVQVSNVSQSKTSVRDRTETKWKSHWIWFDPIAQSIAIETPGGEYVTKCDVFFQSKDETIPVTLQIREMKNGYPTTKVLPFASVTLTPDEINIDDSSQTSTSFVFDSPVYLKDGTEYAIVMISDSDKYLVWISRMGETDVVSNRLISDQPTLGVFFKSQNNSTWVASQLEDLKFTLYRAEFDTSKIGHVQFVNDEVPTKMLLENPIQTYAGESKIKVHFDNHQMHSLNNNVTLSGVIGNRKDSAVNLTYSGSLTDSLEVATAGGSGKGLTVSVKSNVITIINPGSGYAVNDTITFNNNSTTFSASVSEVEDTIGGIPISKINTTHQSIELSTLDYFILNIDLSEYGMNSAFENASYGGKEVYSTQNIQFETAQTLIPIIEHPDTQTTARIKTTSATSASGSEQSFIQGSYEEIALGENYQFKTSRMVPSRINEVNEMGGSKSLFLDLEIKSSESNLSPIIDTDRKSLVCVNNRIDNIDANSDLFPLTDYIEPTAPTGDSNEMIYMTRKIQLKNPATSLKLYFESMRPSGCEIQAMYKILRSDDTSDFDDIGWQYFNTDGGPDVAVNPAASSADFAEYEYTENDVNEFISFAIKIRGQSSDATKVPMIQNLRAIALAT